MNIPNISQNSLPHLEYEEVWQGWQEGGNPGKEGEQVGARWGKGAHHCLVPGQRPMIVVWWGFRGAVMLLIFKVNKCGGDSGKHGCFLCVIKLANFQPQKL